MFLVHLLELPLPLFVQDVSEPAAVTGTSATDPGGLLRDAGNGAVVPEERGERRLGPVGLDAPTLRRPVLGVPDAAVQPHWLVQRERDIFSLLVLHLPDRRAIDKYPAHRGDLGLISAFKFRSCLPQSQHF